MENQIYRNIIKGKKEKTFVDRKLSFHVSFIRILYKHLYKKLERIICVTFRLLILKRSVFGYYYCIRFFSIIDRKSFQQKLNEFSVES